MVQQAWSPSFCSTYHHKYICSFYLFTNFEACYWKLHNPAPQPSFQKTPPFPGINSEWVVIQSHKVVGFLFLPCRVRPHCKSTTASCNSLLLKSLQKRARISTSCHIDESDIFYFKPHTPVENPKRWLNKIYSQLCF